jgi:glycosyltransferase-like protein LARGE
MLVMYEVLGEPAMHLLFPINSLRNAALLAAASPLIAMIDVDLVMASSLGQQLVTAPPSERSAR